MVDLVPTQTRLYLAVRLHWPTLAHLLCLRMCGNYADYVSCVYVRDVCQVNCCVMIFEMKRAVFSTQ